MYPESGCPLTPALRQLLQASIDAGTASDRRLAEWLNVSHHTVHTQFRRVGELMGTRTRTEALLLALKRGWVTMDPGPERTAKD